MTQKGKEESFWLKYQGGPPEDGTWDPAPAVAALHVSAAKVPSLETAACWKCCCSSLQQWRWCSADSTVWLKGITASIGLNHGLKSEYLYLGWEIPWAKVPSLAWSSTAVFTSIQLNSFLCLSIQGVLPDCSIWTTARQHCKLGQSEPRQTCGWAHNQAHNPVLIRKAKVTEHLYLTFLSWFLSSLLLAPMALLTSILSSDNIIPLL